MHFKLSIQIPSTEHATKYINAQSKHYANPMMHPVTGDIVSSYKKAINNPSIAELWKTAFGKEFGGLTQGDTKQNTAGTNTISVMSHKNI